MGQRVTPLAKAAASEDRLKLLRELRARVVEALDEAQCVRDVEPLARRLAAISAEIDELAGQREPTGSPADVIAARRAERRRRGEPVAIDHSVARGTKLHG
jgi:hypothetical protein